MTDLEREWSEVPTDLAGWAMRATKVLRQRDTLLAALKNISRHHPVDDYVQQEADAAIAEVES